MPAAVARHHYFDRDFGRMAVKLLPCEYYVTNRACDPAKPDDPTARVVRANALPFAPGRLLWGTDWPHVMLKGAMPNDADLVDLLERWLPDEALRGQVLVRNPQALYGFPS